jgi:hypothetical protein
MRFWFDTEFIDDGRTVDLISIGIVAEDGRTYYAEVEECDLSRGCEWVQKNVIPHLTGEKKSRAVIAGEIKTFVGDRPQFWAWFGAYDWVALCQLYGRMIDLPKDWPMFVMDVMQLLVLLRADRRALPEQSTTAHNALNDAIWTRDAWRYLASAFTPPKQLSA